MKKTLHLLLADDDEDDRFLFGTVLKSLPNTAKLSTIENGEKLMEYLNKNYLHLPDVLFLDLNMPRKNGSECLVEIKNNEKLKDLPVIIYSTSLNDDVADVLYNCGAHYYMRKTDILDLKKALKQVLDLLERKKFTRPSREKFIFSLIEV
ncbi:MAG: response regulator rcp1 [Bacteroidetes bacterium]|jgi:CheY-like chemotaxis protein|nr:response regulator rcp1 [Bacteroidota bacterium]